MARSRIAALALALSASIFGTAADGQARFGMAAGVALPAGEFGDAVNSGVSVEANLEGQPRGMPFAIRGDLFLSRFGLDSEATGESGSIRGIGGALSALFQLAGAGITPYLLAGPMLANLDISIDGSSDEAKIGNNVGVQAGAGAKFLISGYLARAEIRLGHVFSKEESVGVPNARWVTFNMGVLFGERR